MNRLTKNNDTQYDLIGKCDTNIEEFTSNHKLRNDLLNKLGQLEDIEEELGIDLITYFKLKPYEIIYVKFDENDKDVLAFPIYEIDVENKFVSIILDECDTGEYLFKDYGKTWSLDKNDLLNDNVRKIPKKKKLRDLTPEEWDKWKEICSYTSCSECIFRYVSCIRSDREECWVNHKDLYSDKFLDQEIEVEDE